MTNVSETKKSTRTQRIERLAIVNRGEAAVRCLRTAKSLREREGGGLEVIVLFTTPDRNTPFVRQADRAILMPSPRGAVAAYLDHDGIIAALKESRADAVWPGWGFVAEDPVFVDRLAAEGILFLGPSADAMRSLGDKIQSKLFAETAGVPVSQWSGGALADEHEALAHAQRIGFPVVLKATAGGGGRGIRIVEHPEALSEAFRSATAEATAAFGNGSLFVEAMVQGGRHIEVQVAADKHGHARAFGCRDCSVQRRHQKVVEEAPPPGLSDAQLERLESAATSLVRHVGYCGVGTVEFLLKGEEFFFLEVNPRLQVEHGLTELIAGIDLVEIQIRIARGESIEGIPRQRRGVALEARVCAEDPDEGFLPSPGRIALFEPALGPHTRVDSGVTTGTVISSDFDSLIAKVITVGEDRAGIDRAPRLRAARFRARRRRRGHQQGLPARHPRGRRFPGGRCRHTLARSLQRRAGVSRRIASRARPRCARRRRDPLLPADAGDAADGRVRRPGNRRSAARLRGPADRSLLRRRELSARRSTRSAPGAIASTSTESPSAP